ncbi:MAG: cellulose synthase/poly-beta-1,6-N-acetylglucosamine synthase-like glycosyltransferase [Planctomycetota bacterium]|jgi:cellulose synthase/poly-beta-1,6-N-acetylglucosamine synthase-like glycosyltransferase
MLQPSLFFLLIVLAVYGFHRLTLLAHFRWAGTDASEEDPGEPADTPMIAVQLPLYNERTVAARLIRAAADLRWPRDRFELQILDDSTDETCGIVDEEVRKLADKGVRAVVVRRNSRAGFKAGALDAGMKISDADFFCVFDADFIPKPDFLERTVPQFQDQRIGMVQARWGHLNRDENQFTRAQSTLLDGHFVVEHTVRHQRGLFFNFNGTAGIWRRETIDGAGGWQHDTLTEDLDLSYRAQLAGWKFVYFPNVVAPAEVPPSIDAFKSQQHRWAKGSVQVYRKLWRRILTGDARPGVKLEAMMHLTGNVGYPLILALALILPFTLPQQELVPWWLHAVGLLFCTLPVALFYDSSQRVQGRTFLQRLRDVPSAMALGIGMSFSQTQAVLEGLGRKTGTFVRTPKRGEAIGVSAQTYRLSWSLWRGFGIPELGLAAWLAWALIQAVQLHLWGAVPFLLLFFTGFAWVGTLSFKTRLART